ncbi:hypothetical protein ABZ070_35260 [Streptomyces sp. NPDC006283]|uniref:hypothetical protein n=1 Tax=Streptomyces sp. NPDC006283 TaxID=3156741 RepID=UPI0033ACA2A4
MIVPESTGTDRPVRGIAALCCWGLVLVVLLPLTVLQSLDARLGAALAVQCVVVVHTGTALARVMTGVRAPVIAFGFWLFSYVWLGLAPLAMLATDTYPHGFVVDAETSFTTTLLVETGLVAYSTGSALASWRASRASSVLEPILARQLSPGRVLLLGGAALLLAVVLIPGQGGLPAFFASRQAANEAAAQASVNRAIAAWALSVPAFWALVGLVHVPRFTAGERTLRGLRWLLLPLLIAVNVVVNNPISQPRFWAGTVLLALVFGTSWLRGPRAFRFGAAGVAFVVLVVFPYSDYFRYDKREPVHVVSLAEQFTSNGDYDGFQQMVAGVDYVRTHGFTPSAALGPPLFFVPRATWPGKPEDTGILLARHAGYTFDNLAAPLWIESYMWAGFPSVLGVFGLIGAVGRRIDDLRYRLRGRPGTLAALLVPAFGFYQLVLLRGSLMAMVGPLALLVCIPLLITRKPGRTALPPAQEPGYTPPYAASSALSTGGART